MEKSETEVRREGGLVESLGRGAEIRVLEPKREGT